MNNSPLAHTERNKCRVSWSWIQPLSKPPTMSDMARIALVLEIKAPIRHQLMGKFNPNPWPEIYSTLRLWVTRRQSAHLGWNLLRSKPLLPRIPRNRQSSLSLFGISGSFSLSGVKSRLFRVMDSRIINCSFQSRTHDPRLAMNNSPSCPCGISSRGPMPQTHFQLVLRLEWGEICREINTNTLEGVEVGLSRVMDSAVAKCKFNSMPGFNLDATWNVFVLETSRGARRVVCWLIPAQHAPISLDVGLRLSWVILSAIGNCKLATSECIHNTIQHSRKLKSQPWSTAASSGLQRKQSTLSRTSSWGFLRSWIGNCQFANKSVNSHNQRPDQPQQLTLSPSRDQVQMEVLSSSNL